MIRDRGGPTSKDEGQILAKAPTQFEPPASKRRRPASRRFGILRALVPYLKPYRALVFAAAIVLVITTLLSLAMPMVVRQLVDHFNAGSMVVLDRYFAIGIVGIAIFAAGTALRFYLVSRLGQSVVMDLRNAVFSRVIGLSPAFYETIMTGEVLSRITTDTVLVQSILGGSAANALRNILTLTGGLFLLLATSMKLGLMVVLIMPITMVPIYVLGRKMRTASREAQDWIAASSGKASESLSAVQTLQSFTHETASKEQFAHYTSESFKAALRSVEIRTLLTFTLIFLTFTACTGVLWLGVRDVQAGLMTPGMLVQFMIYALMVAGAVTAMAQFWGEMQRAAGATDRLIELLKVEDGVVDPEIPVPLATPVTGHIVFEDVHFIYPTRPDTAALGGVSLEIMPGETVALVGPSGAGKTTIVQLIQRFYDPTGGRITLDGQDLRDLARADFRRSIALVPQDPAIFAASAIDNIQFGRPGADQTQIEDAAKAAAAHQFITGFPNGYDSRLGERGVMLSGGQKQRIAIARAILRDAPILLLDEATSALDAESEGAVQEAVDRLSRDRTTIIIAHRLATVKKADRIIVLDEGQVVATGTHTELVAAGGLYARLAKLQFIA